MDPQVAAALIAAAATVVAAVIGVWAHVRKKRPAPDRADNGEQGTQAAAVCYRRTGAGVEFLLVRTTGGRWTFPKGNVGDGETGARAAEREAFEEAGATGVVETKPLTVYRHQKREFKRRGVEYRIAAYLLRVESTREPLEPNRTPTWFTPKDAEQALVEDREFRYADELRRVMGLACEALR